MGLRHIKTSGQWNQTGFAQQSESKGYKQYPISFPKILLSIIASGYTNERESDYRYNYYCSPMYNSTIVGDQLREYTVTGFRTSKVLEKIDQWNYNVWAFIIAIGY